jgi:hypothetical protein
MLSLPTHSAVALGCTDLISLIGMRLVPCSPPPEPLDAAPRSALLRDAEPGTDWAGFWSRTTDGYFARCTTGDGATHWYRITDEMTDAAPSPSLAAPPRVLPFRGDAMRRVNLVVAASPGGRPMIVGGSVRRAAK